MANQEHVDLINRGAQVWNQWRQDHPELRPDLYAAHLKNADLSGMNLSSATLTVAILYKAAARPICTGPTSAAPI